jgi:hypothetical protein
MTEAAWDWDEQLEESASDLTRNDRFSAVLVLVLAALALALGLLLRERADVQTWTYSSRAAGLEAQYPAGWLVDEGGSYVMRVRDPVARPYKTQYQIAIVPAGGQTSIRNVLDSLTLQRSTDLAAYRVLSVQETGSGNERLTEMNFAFVDADPNPFIQRLPVVVLGTDIVTRDGDRAIVVTYMAAEDSYEANYPGFERFLASLRY